MKKIFPKVLENKPIADNIFKMTLAGDFSQREFLPGRFLHVKCSAGLDPLLRRPMSICDVSDDECTLTVLYRKDGRGTTLLSELLSGETVDILAPLGNNFPLPEDVSSKDIVAENAEVEVPQQCPKRVLLIGGGIGVPPLYYLGRKLKAKGHEIISILGFNSAKDLFYEEEFKTLGETYISTVDGTYGVKGFVTDVLRDLEVANNAESGASGKPLYDYLYSCGPKAMLKALQGEIDSDKEAYMSLEERMGCGVGACLACVCDYAEPFIKDKKYSRICTEGPVYKLHEVVL